PFMRRSPLASATPLSEIPVDFPGGWPALLVDTPLAGRPTQSVTFGELLELYGPSGTPNAALRDLTLDEVSVFDGTPFADASPAAFLLGSTPVVSIDYGAQTWCARLASDTADDEHPATCATLGVGPTTTLLELDVDEKAAAVFAAHPDLRRVPL